MTSSIINFVHQNRIVEVKNPDPVLKMLRLIRIESVLYELL